MSDVDLRNGRGYGHDETEPLEADKTLGDLLGQLSSDFSNLVSTQVELAKVEIQEEAARAGKSASLLGAGAFVAYLSLLLLSFAAAWGLSEAMPTGFAFLIVGAVYAVIAAVLITQGRQRLREVRGPVVTSQTVKEDVQWAKQQMS
jgi:uncharacterized membrane protein YqjE